MIERAFIEQGIRKVELDQFLRSKLERAGFTKSEIVKTPLVTRIVVNVVSPGLAIGKGGENIRMLTEAIKTRYGIENPQLEIKEIPKVNLDAQAVCDKIIASVERGFSWRSVCFRTVRDIMSSGAKGVEIIVKGVIAGKGQRKRKQRLAEGYMKKVGNEALLVDYAKDSAITKIGAIGFKVRIVRPDVQFLDKIDLEAILHPKGKEEAPQPVKAEEKQEAQAEVVQTVEKAEKSEEKKETPHVEKKEKKHKVKEEIKTEEKTE